MDRTEHDRRRDEAAMRREAAEQTIDAGVNMAGPMSPETPHPADRFTAAEVYQDAHRTARDVLASAIGGEWRGQAVDRIVSTVLGAALLDLEAPWRDRTDDLAGQVRKLQALADALREQADGLRRAAERSNEDRDAFARESHVKARTVDELTGKLDAARADVEQARSWAVTFESRAAWLEDRLRTIAVQAREAGSTQDFDGVLDGLARAFDALATDELSGVIPAPVADWPADYADRVAGVLGFDLRFALDTAFVESHGHDTIARAAAAGARQALFDLDHKPTPATIDLDARCEACGHRIGEHGPHGCAADDEAAMGGCDCQATRRRSS